MAFKKVGTSSEGVRDEYRCLDCDDVRWWTNDKDKIPCFVCGKEGITSYEYRDYKAAQKLAEAIEDRH